MRIPGPGEQTRQSLRLMGGASALTTLGSIPPFLLGAQAVWVRDDLAVGLGVFGVAVSVFFAAAALGSLGAGVLLDRLGRRAGLATAGVLVAGGGAAMALLVSGPLSLLACMAVLGLGNASCQTAANLSMARALPPGRRGLGFGVKQSAIPLAIMLGGLAVPTLGGQLGWRSTFVATALAGTLVLGRAVARSGASAFRPPGAAAAELDRPPWAPLLLAGLGITFASAAANFLGAFVASWGYEVGLSATTAGLLMAAGSAGSIAVRVLSGHRADARQGRNLPVVAVQMYAGAACLVGLAIAHESTVLVFGFLAFAVGWAWPGLLLFAVARVGRDTPARASGVVQAGAFTGGAVGPMGFGALAGQVGFQPTWLLAACSFVVAGTLVLLARRGFRADLLARPPREPLAHGGSRVR
ncbi:MFS transporter [Nocardioides coralli]|uniref:MFS transporter n=1 Tax=Nocardioides coralli TaxID=2872154 RepID=UPI001CA3FFD8|nr:MFS transporter [Nocardioides coralli]QZY27890.1 MFS transporter [Nocardioides coralli]